MSNIMNILNGDNVELAELIETIKNSGKIEIIRDLISSVKDEYFVDDKIHGISHNERVLILAIYMGIKEGLTDNELKLLAQSALYHDIGRKNKAENENHGDKTARIIEEEKEKIFPDLNEEEIKVVKALSVAHSHSDIEMENIANANDVTDVPSFIKAAQILKDADALDRVRLQNFGKLKVDYLRTDTSKEMIDIAEELYFESINVLNIPDDRNQNIRLEDDKYIYLFRALTEKNIEDRENGIVEIRPNSIVDYEETGNKGEYIDKAELSLEELYKHVRLQYSHCYTNCISLTEDPGVALTYNQNKKAYAMIKIPKDNEDYSKKIVDARKYFVDELVKIINETDISSNREIESIMLQIEKARSNEELRKIIKDFDNDIAISFVNDRQYLDKKSELEYHKILAKIKILEKNELIGDIIDGVENERIYSAIGNAFTSAEYIHYGTISKENIIECPQIYMDIFSLIGQAKENGVDEREILKVLSQVIKLMQDERRGLISDDRRRDLEQKYAERERLNNELTIEQAYELTNGQVNYAEVKMQMNAIKVIAEITLKKQMLMEYLNEKLPEITNLSEIFKDTYLINPEIVLKQNGRGHQITNTVNIVIAENGREFNSKYIGELIEKISKLSKEQLNDIYTNGINSKETQELLLIKEEREKIEPSKLVNDKTKYMADAIVEGYNWKKVRGALTIQEKKRLVNKIIGNAKKGELENLYSNLCETYEDGKKINQQEIFAIMINIAIDGKLGKISYNELIRLPKEKRKKIIEESKEILPIAITPIEIDLLMKRGKRLKKVKNALIEIGVEKEFLEEIDIRNIYIANEIVEGYDWNKAIGRKLEKEEKRAVIKNILGNSYLGEKISLQLTTLIEKFERKGYNKQEIYGAIINLGINGSFKSESGYDYSSILTGSAKIEELELINDDIEITETLIMKGKSKSLTKKEEHELKKYLIRIGIKEKFLEEKDIRNIYIANEIVEGYDWNKAIGRDIEEKEKREIIKNILDNSLLGKGIKNQLSTLINKIEKKVEDKQDIYGVIINLGINGGLKNKIGYDYSKMISGTAKLEGLELSKEDKEIGKETFFKISEIEQSKLKESLIKIGVEKEFLEEKAIRNIYVANQIVEGYNWNKVIGRKLEEEEKRAIIKNILANSLLGGINPKQLSVLIEKLESKVKSKEEIHGVIINLGINGGLKNKVGYDYSKMIGGTAKIEGLELSKEDKEIGKETFFKISRIEQSKLIKSLLKIGIEEEFLKEKDIRNIYIANQIVEGYNWNKAIGRKLEEEEKRAIIKNILKPSILGGKSPRQLSGLIENLESKVKSREEIYGVIVNLGINGVLNKDGFTYTNMIARRIKIEELELVKEDTEVTENTIIKAKAQRLTRIKGKTQNLTIESENKLKKYLIRIGIEEEFLEEKDIRNIYVANEIVEGYNWNEVIGRELEEEEKRAIIKNILKPSILGGSQTNQLTTLIKRLESKTKNKEEIYGVIINLGINLGLKNKTGYEYTNVLRGTAKIEELELSKEDAEVTENTIVKGKLQNLTIETENKLKKSLIRIGVEEEFLEEKDIRNIYSK